MSAVVPAEYDIAAYSAGSISDLILSLSLFLLHAAPVVVGHLATSCVLISSSSPPPPPPLGPLCHCLGFRGAPPPPPLALVAAIDEGRARGTEGKEQGKWYV